MRDFQRKQQIRKVLYSKAALVAVLILLVIVGKATWSVYTKERESQKNLTRVENELASLQAREQKLQKDITHLQTPEGVETEIREQFQVAKPGERMIVLVEEGRAAPAEAPTERSLVSKFLDIFR